MSPRTRQPEEGQGLHSAQCGQESDRRVAEQGARTVHALSERGFEARLSVAADGAQLSSLGHGGCEADLWLHLWAGVTHFPEETKKHLSGQGWQELGSVLWEVSFSAEGGKACFCPPSLHSLVSFQSIAKNTKLTSSGVGLLAGWVLILFASSILLSLPIAPPKSFDQNNEYQASVQGAVVGSMQRGGDGAAETWSNSSVSFFFLDTTPGQAGHLKVEQPALSEL